MGIGWVDEPTASECFPRRQDPRTGSAVGLSVFRPPCIQRTIAAINATAASRPGPHTIRDCDCGIRSAPRDPPAPAPRRILPSGLCQCSSRGPRRCPATVREGRGRGSVDEPRENAGVPGGSAQIGAVLEHRGQDVRTPSRPRRACGRSASRRAPRRRPRCRPGGRPRLPRACSGVM